LEGFIGLGILFVCLIATLIVVAAKYGRNRVKLEEEEVNNKAEQGKSQISNLLEKREFKTKKSAISYTATIHRLYHKKLPTGRVVGEGIRSSCEFCEELLFIINDHFD